MTYEEYWYGDPLMVRAFYKANQLKQKIIDAEAWLHGMYVLRALDATVGNMFRKSGSQMAEYPERPLKSEDEEKPMTEEEEANYALAYMTNMVLVGKNWNK